MEFDKDKVDEMTLALLYLVMWDEKIGSSAWKGFDWETMNRLHEEGYISNPVGKAKSVSVTPEGMEKLLWDYYHYLIEHYGNESFSDGPLLGLYEMRARRREKSDLAASGSIPDSRGKNKKEEPGRIC